MFWNNFDKYWKIGIIEDDKHIKELVPLLRVHSSKNGDECTSFEQYIDGMPEGQKSIYYVTGEGKKNVTIQSKVEKLTPRGYEVLLKAYRRNHN